MLKRILLILVALLLLGAVAVGVFFFFSSRRTAEAPTGTLSPEELNEEPLFTEGESGASPAPLFEATPEITVSQDTGVRTVSQQALLSPNEWEGQPDQDTDGLPDAIETLYTTDSAKADTDGDGFSDGAEVKNGFDPTKSVGNPRLDSDHDTLFEHEEHQWKTHPFIADTDGDGFSDGAEVKNGFDPTKKGDGKGSDALPGRRASQADAVLRPNPTSSNVTESLAGTLLGNRPVSEGTKVNVTAEQVRNILDKTKISTTLPAVSVSEIKTTSTNTREDIQTYLAAVDALRPSELIKTLPLAQALGRALSGQPAELQQIRARLADYEDALLRVDVPASAVDYHALLVSLQRFTNERLGVIETNAVKDPAKAYLAAREIAEGLPQPIEKLKSLRQALEGKAR